MTKAGHGLCGWLEDHIDGFLLCGRPQESMLEGLKRSSEFALVLVGITRFGGRMDAGPLHASWSRTIAHTLWCDLHDAEKELRERVTLRSSPVTRALLLVFPALEIVTGRSFGNRTWLARMLAPAARPEGRPDVNLAFTRDMAGLHDCREQALAELARTRSASGPGVSRQSMYDVTHAIFYATRMGLRRPTWNREQAMWVHAYLERSGAACLSTGDLDLTAESVMSLLMAGFPISRYIDDVVHVLAAVVENESSIPPRDRYYDAAGDEFINRYHSTLTGLAALTEYESASLRMATNGHGGARDGYRQGRSFLS